MFRTYKRNNQIAFKAESEFNLLNVNSTGQVSLDIGIIIELTPRIYELVDIAEILKEEIEGIFYINYLIQLI